MTYPIDIHKFVWNAQFHMNYVIFAQIDDDDDDDDDVREQDGDAWYWPYTWHYVAGCVPLSGMGRMDVELYMLKCE